MAATIWNAKYTVNTIYILVNGDLCQKYDSMLTKVAAMYQSSLPHVLLIMIPRT
jgi:hypothetical protein